MNEVECPYCGYENDMTDDLIEMSENEFDRECAECEKEFEVLVEFDPVISASEIEIIDCENCGKETREFHRKGQTFPFPKAMGDKTICKSCFLTSMGEEYRESEANANT
ncbi:hypothetical protein [Gracilibacillus saliphilus]|uniref:hypothetical protein n=1 Tax=Gracilibacillus saliphilus TaxID=543890 RepID=UPI0013D2BCF1|nr:hypothetical protein [Gracilibacillus saliphilus]